ncbi:MAG: response regulator, partial [Thermodesulfovibrionales bacterium]|nr:response regulator [Thermodesulfovibrionales bacterium]
MNGSNILLVDDEQNTLKVISAILKKKGFDVITALSAEIAIEKLLDNNIDLVITDYKLPGKSGIDLVEIIAKKNRNLPIIMLTAYGTIEKAVEAMKKGAFNYLTKPVNPDELLIVVNEALEKQRIIKENMILKFQLKEINSFQNIIGKSSKMQELFNLITTVSRSNSNILITGESGTG